jgi:SWI/SNF-related matrix-associated actin-dependent regulator of chromatin subfamily A member 5
MGAIQKFKWEYLIVDEAHKLKNEDSQISQRLR